VVNLEKGEHSSTKAGVCEFMQGCTTRREDTFIVGAVLERQTQTLSQITGPMLNMVSESVLLGNE
jgi:hypothetical protein